MLKSVSCWVFTFFCFSALILFGFLVRVEWLPVHEPLDKLIYLNRFCVDFLQIGAVTFLLFSNKVLIRSLSYLLVLIFAIAYWIQFLSYSTSGNFLPQIALENAEHVDFLDIGLYTYTAIVWLIFYVIFVALLEKITFKPKLLIRLVIAIALLLISVIVKNDKVYLDEQTLTERNTFFNSGMPGFSHASPISKLKKTLKGYQKYLEQQKIFVDRGVETELSPNAIKYLGNYFPHFGKEDPEYPLVKKQIYHGEPPYDLNGNGMNLIVIFAEGMSSRVIQPYSNHFPNISPNIEDFSKHAIVVDNYINHSYATYRGLSGQLCSTHAIGRLIEGVNYNCFPHLLNEQGYETRFIFSQDGKSTNLDEVIKRSGFSFVDDAEALMTKKGGLNGQRRISDKKLFESLIDNLKSKESNEPNKPFFFGMYNFETHNGVRLTGNYQKYIRNLSSHYITDTFHNFDTQFGKFWTYLKNSPFYENTIVVLTADHATFPGRDFRKIIKGSKGYTSLFIDKIPLIIYHPQLTERKSKDAKFTSSVDLAPSLAHLMGLKNFKNSFVGKSIFDDSINSQRAYGRGDGAIHSLVSSSYHFTILKESEPLTLSNTNSHAQLELIKYFQQLERSNKLWRVD